MTLGAEKDWRKEFGLDQADARLFFADKADLARRGSPASQVHVLRHAFELLEVDGVLCSPHAPLIYFKKVPRVDAARVVELHRRFWNHGGAPVLVLITREDVHVYSGLVQPVERADLTGNIPALVETLNRTAAVLRQFIPAVETGAYFSTHSQKFDPANRVDRMLLDNLKDTREKLIETAGAGHDTKILDALLCRLVFACYLFDREVVGPAYLEQIGIQDARHLRDVLALQPRSKAKQSLYALFEKLAQDFNGDLFSTNVPAEARQIPVSHLDTLNEFFQATQVKSGQRSFWPYDFSFIPVEVISAIYERFLQNADRNDGAFYTPRFLAEAVLDVALAPMHSLLDGRYLDPACGSGIFLVGLFNRMAEEWKRKNSNVRNDRRARELRTLLCNSLYGIDINPTACRITAFSLYLAYLDQLSPRDIRELQQNGHKLPRLVHDRDSHEEVEGNIWCRDFFDTTAPYPADVDLVIGNPPWGSVASADTLAARWCAAPERNCPVPDKQISATFVWKAPRHVRNSGRVSLVLPHGTLFNHSSAAVNFQREFFERYTVDHVLNLTDYRFFLFTEAIHPAVVITYRPLAPRRSDIIDYWVPKADWLSMRAQVISVGPEDRSRIAINEVLADLQGPDAPQIWKQRYWTTPRDRRLIDRLSLYRRLRDSVRQSRENAPEKRWLIAEGFQPVGKSDDPEKAATIRLPSRLFVNASSPHLDLFLLPQECTTLPGTDQRVRAKSNKNTAIFRAPHVLVAKGFTSIAFADFDVSFRHAVRGISGPKEDANMLAFLAAYARSSLARYFAFHTSSNWGIYRPEVHVEELLRIPFPWPHELPNPARAREIIGAVAQIVTGAATRSKEFFSNRTELVRHAQESIERLVDEYFDVLPVERIVVDDTMNIVVPSVQPTLSRIVPTLEASDAQQRRDYMARLTGTLNRWARPDAYRVGGDVLASSRDGIGIAILEKRSRGDTTATVVAADCSGFLDAFDALRKAAAQKLDTFELTRGAKVFDGSRLYVVKPITRRFWTQTAALVDADEIASTILMHSSEQPA